MTTTADTDNIRYEVNDGIALITLNRPDRLNALLPDMTGAYADQLRKADEDSSVRAIVVTGAGRGFCAGADLAGLASGTAALDAFLATQSFATSPAVALHIGKPVATAINGPCAGLGFVLAISADARFASSTATFSTTFVRLGLIAEYGSAWLLTRLVGLATATDLLLTGRTISADEARSIGLVNAVSDDALASAMAWARDIADHCSPYAIAAMKRQLIDVDGQSLLQSVESALGEMSAAFAQPDLAEAIKAKAEKRPAVFPPLS